MNRYSDTPLYKTSTGIQYQGLTRYPEIPYGEDDVYTFPVAGDRLDNLAYQFYGDSSLYWIIAAANPQIAYNLLYTVPGVQLRIPFPVDRVLSSFNEINNG